MSVAPTLVGEGSIVANTTPANLTATLPSHQTDDFLFAMLGLWAPNTATNVNAFTTPANWTQLFSANIVPGAQTDGRLALYYRRAPSGSTTSPVFNVGANWDGGTDMIYFGRSFAFRGVEPNLATPWDDSTSGGAITAANGNFRGLTISGANRLAVQFVFTTDNAGVGATSGGYTKETAANSSSGTGASTCVFDKTASSNVAAVASNVPAPAQGAYTIMAVALIPPNTHVGGVAAEADSGKAATAAKFSIGGFATETDTGLADSGLKIYTGGLANETDSTPDGIPIRVYVAGFASETDTGLADAPTKTAQGGVAAETETPFGGSASKTVFGGIATETDTALLGTYARTFVGGVAAESDAAQAGTQFKTAVAGIAAEGETAYSGSASKTAFGGVATEGDAALQGSVLKTFLAGVAAELDQAIGGGLADTVKKLTRGGLVLFKSLGGLVKAQARGGQPKTPSEGGRPKTQSEGGRPSTKVQSGRPNHGE